MSYKLSSFPLPVRKQIEQQLALDDRPKRHAVTPASDKYRSDPERWYAMELQARVLAGEVVAWAYEPDKFVLSDQPQVRYTPDFRVDFANGRRVYVEVKAPHKFYEKGRLKFLWAKEKYKEHEWTLILPVARRNGTNRWRVGFSTLPKTAMRY